MMIVCSAAAFSGCEPDISQRRSVRGSRHWPRNPIARRPPASRSHGRDPRSGNRRRIFALHLVEIAIFALFYLAVDALQTVEAALYFSMSAYSTLGHPDLDFPDDWRLVGAVEGLIGFLLIGWSTAVFIADMNKVIREQ